MAAATTKRLPIEFVQVNGHCVLQCEIFSVSVKDQANWFTPAHKKEIFTLLDETLLHKSQEFLSDRNGCGTSSRTFRDGNVHKVVGKLQTKAESKLAIDLSEPKVLCGESVRIAFCFQDSLMAKNKILIKSDDRYRSFKLLPEKLVIYAYLMSKQSDSTTLASNNSVLKDVKIDGTLSSFFSATVISHKIEKPSHSAVHGLQTENSNDTSATMDEHFNTDLRIFNSALSTKTTDSENPTLNTKHKAKLKGAEPLPVSFGTVLEKREQMNKISNDNPKKRSSDSKDLRKEIKRIKIPAVIARKESGLKDKFCDSQNTGTENSSVAGKLSRFKFRRISKSKLIMTKGLMSGNSPSVRAAKASIDRAHRRKSVPGSVLLCTSQSEQCAEKLFDSQKSHDSVQSSESKKLWDSEKSHDSETSRDSEKCISNPIDIKENKLAEPAVEMIVVKDVLTEIVPSVIVSKSKVSRPTNETRLDKKQNHLPVATKLHCSDVRSSRVSRSSKVNESRNEQEDSDLNDEFRKSTDNGSTKTVHMLMSPTEDDFDFKRPRISSKREARKDSKLCSRNSRDELAFNRTNIPSCSGSSISGETSCGPTNSKSQVTRSSKSNCSQTVSGSTDAIIIDDCDVDNNSIESVLAITCQDSDKIAKVKIPISQKTLQNDNLKTRSLASIPISLTLLPDLVSELSGLLKDNTQSKSSDSLPLLSSSSSGTKKRSNGKSDTSRSVRDSSLVSLSNKLLSDRKSGTIENATDGTGSVSNTSCQNSKSSSRPTSTDCITDVVCFGLTDTSTLKANIENDLVSEFNELDSLKVSDTKVSRNLSTKNLTSEKAPSIRLNDNVVCSAKSDIVVIDDEEDDICDENENLSKSTSRKSVNTKVVQSLDRQLKDVRDIDDLTINQLWLLVMENKEYFQDIATGKILCKRHQQYLSGEKRFLSYATLECIYSDEQKQEVILALQKIFYRNKRNFEYVLKVLLPEALVKIYQRIRKISDRDEAEKAMCEHAMVINSLSQMEHLS